MDGVLWYVLASSRGGPTRVRILRAIAERPRNANQLATELGYDYTTIRHHLDVLMENNVLRRSGEEYAAVYLFTDQVKSNWEVVEEILRTVDPEGEHSADGEESAGGRPIDDRGGDAAPDEDGATGEDGGRRSSETGGRRRSEGDVDGDESREDVEDEEGDIA